MDADYVAPHQRSLATIAAKGIRFTLQHSNTAYSSTGVCAQCGRGTKQKCSSCRTKRNYPLALCKQTCHDQWHRTQLRANNQTTEAPVPARVPPPQTELRPKTTYSQRQKLIAAQKAAGAGAGAGAAGRVGAEAEGEAQLQQLPAPQIPAPDHLLVPQPAAAETGGGPVGRGPRARATPWARPEPKKRPAKAKQPNSAKAKPRNPPSPGGPGTSRDA